RSRGSLGKARAAVRRPLDHTTHSHQGLDRDGSASGLLPDPSVEAAVLVLPPNTAYEVRFAWVPSGEACTPTNPDAGGNPPQTGSAGSSGAPAQGAATEPQTGAPPAASGVSVSHTPQPGSSATRTTLPEACGGTVYRTGAIPVAK
ncbi:hypothetical protein AB0B44_40870, partial [Streptomyces sp. NPDC041003]